MRLSRFIPEAKSKKFETLVGKEQASLDGKEPSQTT
jgi:hypothetical protein